MVGRAKIRLTALRKGDWVPLIPYPFRGIILAAWVVIPIPYGLDYLSENPDKGNRLSIVESALPLPVWGSLMIAAGLAASVSLIMRWRMRTVVALHILGAIWFTLAIGLLADSISKLGGDGYRSFVLFLAVSITYWSAAVGYYYQEDEADEGEILVEKEE